MRIHIATASNAAEAKRADGEKLEQALTKRKSVFAVGPTMQKRVKQVAGLQDTAKKLLVASTLDSWIKKDPPANAAGGKQ